MFLADENYLHLSPLVGDRPEARGPSGREGGKWMAGETPFRLPGRLIWSSKWGLCLSRGLGRLILADSDSLSKPRVCGPETQTARVARSGRRVFSGRPEVAGLFITVGGVERPPLGETPSGVPQPVPREGPLTPPHSKPQIGPRHDSGPDLSRPETTAASGREAWVVSLFRRLSSKPFFARRMVPAMRQGVASCPVIKASQPRGKAPRCAIARALDHEDETRTLYAYAAVFLGEVRPSTC